MLEHLSTFLHDLKFAARSLGRAKGLTVTVVLTLALGIGANAAMFSLVRGVLLRPLVNRDEDRLIYIWQSAQGAGISNAYFSMPEIRDLESRLKTLNAFGDFSEIGFTMVGLGKPREVVAGVAGGSYFDVMGLHPVLGRLLNVHDDGPAAAGAVVLTYRFWSTTLKSDPSVLGKTVRLGSFGGSRPATVVGVLEPCVPYPDDTEIIANVVTSPHHLSATMVDGRIHRMTNLFARLAPGVDIDKARAELRTVYGTMKREHPEAYSRKADSRINAALLRDQLTSKARTILLVLMAASILVFVIACSNVANLILARTVRREGELGIRAAMGASTAALRRVLLAESLLLCVAGAAIGLLIAQPMVTVLARYASRYSARALDLTIDSSMLWVGAVLAVLAAVLLAFVPRLPQSGGEQGFNLSSSSTRVTGSANRRLRVFAVTQIAASFVLVAGAGAMVTTLMALQSAQTGLDMRHVLAVNVPIMSEGKTPTQVSDFYKEMIRRIRQLPGVDNVAIGTAVPWRDTGFGFGLEFSADGHVRGPGEEDPRAKFRVISPGFFATLGLPIVAGRDFDDADRKSGELVAIVSESVATRMFPNGDALNHHMMWTDPVTKFIDVTNAPRRIVGVVADMDDEHVIPGPALSVYHPVDQQGNWAGRLFVRAHSDPHGLVTPIARIIHNMSADQVVEQASTLEEVRAQVLTPDRLNAMVFGIFAGVALLIAVVGVAGVLAFSVSGRTREFGIRLAIGSQPRHLLARVMVEGAGMALGGLAVGFACGFGLAQLAGNYFGDLKTPGFLPVASAAFVLLLAAVIASVIPAARAARVDVMQALRTE
jgi:predicted permease